MPLPRYLKFVSSFISFLCLGAPHSSRTVQIHTYSHTNHCACFPISALANWETERCPVWVPGRCGRRTRSLSNVTAQAVERPSSPDLGLLAHVNHASSDCTECPGLPRRSDATLYGHPLPWALTLFCPFVFCLPVQDSDPGGPFGLRMQSTWCSHGLVATEEASFGGRWWDRTS